MLKNFIVDAELKKYHPGLSKQLWSAQSTYATQIDEAYHIIITDINNKGLNPRLLMTPFDLLTSGSTVNFVSTTTKTADSTGTGIEGDNRNYKRFVVDVNSITGTWVFSVQGSNDNLTFETITSLTATTIGEQSEVYDNTYKYWRYDLDNTSAGGTDSVNFSTYLVEDVWDRLIIYKTFELIFSDFRKSQNDAWDLLVQDYARKYDNELTSLKFLYDANESGTIEDGEVGSNNVYFIL